MSVLYILIKCYVPDALWALAVQYRWKGTGRSSVYVYGYCVQLYTQNWSTNDCAGPSVHISRKIKEYYEKGHLF